MGRSTEHGVDLFWREGGAQLSPCMTYRYTLDRIWDAGLPRLAWVMLNPSTADGREDDPTIRKCIGFSKRWGFGSLVVVNLYPWRATDPRDLVRAKRANRLVGGDSHARAAVDTALRGADAVCAAWGAHPMASRAGDDFVTDRLRGRPVLCIGRTGDGSPRHPLMAPYTPEPQLYRGVVANLDEVPTGAPTRHQMPRSAGVAEAG